MMNLQRVEFVKSAAQAGAFLHDGLPQIAFAGKSNVGKSSVLNCVLQRKNFARVGQKPGKTVHINYFRVDGKAHFVDLPGYGYAQVAESEKERWGKLMEAYFAEPEPIALGVMIVDARHAPTKLDCVMADLFRSTGRPFLVVANKLDKLKAREIEPNLACPSSVENVHPLSEVVANGPIKLNQGYIGSCTGGRVEDIAIAAKILKGRHIPEDTRLIVVPASNEVMQECMKAGYIQDLMNAGATITTPGCGACLGAHEGILAPGEVCITSTNRNFPGRMGSTEALMYLASPATVAASMVNGCITDPRDFL